jgi:hypothetical protein
LRSTTINACARAILPTTAAGPRGLGAQALLDSYGEAALFVSSHTLPDHVVMESVKCALVPYLPQFEKNRRLNRLFLIVTGPVCGLLVPSPP